MALPFIFSTEKVPYKEEAMAEGQMGHACTENFKSMKRMRENSCLMAACVFESGLPAVVP